MPVVSEPIPEVTDATDSKHIEIIENVLKEGISLINGMQPEKPPLDLDKDHVFLGDKAVVDSLGLVTYLNAVEGLLYSEYGVSLDVISERAMSMRASPFLRTSTLRKYLLNELTQIGK